MSLGVTAGARIPHLLSNIDPYFDNTILLLRGQGDDGGSVITDSSNPLSPYQGNWNPPDSIAGVTTENDQSLPGFGETSLFFPASGQPDIRYSSLQARTYLGNVITAGNPGQTVWTMEAWVRQSSSGVMGILSYRPPVAIGWAFTTTGWRASIGSVWSDTWISVAAPSVDVWSHRAMVRNGNDWLYWAGGALVGSFTNSGDIDVNAAEVSVGHGSTSNTEQQFRGHMYLRFTGGVARYLSPFTPPRNFPAVGP